MVQILSSSAAILAGIQPDRTSRIHAGSALSVSPKKGGWSNSRRLPKRILLVLSSFGTNTAFRRQANSLLGRLIINRWQANWTDK